MLRVVKPMMNPAIAKSLEMVMCHVLSFILPEEYATRIVTIAERRYGGHVNASVTVVLNPKVLTTVGRKFLNPLALRWRLYVNVRIQVL